MGGTFAFTLFELSCTITVSNVIGLSSICLEAMDFIEQKQWFCKIRGFMHTANCDVLKRRRIIDVAILAWLL